MDPNQNSRLLALTLPQARGLSGLDDLAPKLGTGRGQVCAIERGLVT